MYGVKDTAVIETIKDHLVASLLVVVVHPVLLLTL